MPKRSIKIHKTRITNKITARLTHNPAIAHPFLGCFKPIILHISPPKSIIIDNVTNMVAADDTSINPKPAIANANPTIPITLTSLGGVSFFRCLSFFSSDSFCPKVSFCLGIFTDVLASKTKGKVFGANVAKLAWEVVVRFCLGIGISKSGILSNSLVYEGWLFWANTDKVQQKTSSVIIFFMMY